MRRNARVLLATGVVLAFLLGGCGSWSASHLAQTQNNLTPDQTEAIVTEPDAVTMALVGAGFHPFAIKTSDGYKDDDSSVIFFGPVGAKLENDHGSMAAPWISRQLAAAKPKTGADYHDFMDGFVIISGDDWAGKGSTRPVIPDVHQYECSTGTDQQVTAATLRLLPSLASTHVADPHFTIEPIAGEVSYICSKM